MTSERHDPTAHLTWDELAVGYAVGALEPDDLESFLHHVAARCPSCQRSVSDTDAIGADLSAALLVDVPAPSSLRASVLSAAFAVRAPLPPAAITQSELGTGLEGGERQLLDSERLYADAPVSAPLPTDPPIRRERWRTPHQPAWVIAAVAAVVAVIMTATAGWAFGALDDARARSSHAETALDSLIGDGPGQFVDLRPATGTGAPIAVIVARRTSVSVIPRTLAPNPPDATYVLWGLASPTSAPVALGVFDVTSNDARVVGADGRGYGQYSTFAISRESGHTAPAAPTVLLALGSE
jgi:hypothetical protein